MRWISVFEKLPEINEMVLIYHPPWVSGGKNMIATGHRIEDRWNGKPDWTCDWDSSIELMGVTFWMQLPDKPI